MILTKTKSKNNWTCKFISWTLKTPQEQWMPKTTCSLYMHLILSLLFLPISLYSTFLLVCSTLKIFIYIPQKGEECYEEDLKPQEHPDYFFLFNCILIFVIINAFNYAVHLLFVLFGFSEELTATYMLSMLFITPLIVFVTSALYNKYKKYCKTIIWE